MDYVVEMNRLRAVPATGIRIAFRIVTLAMLLGSGVACSDRVDDGTSSGKLPAESGASSGSEHYDITLESNGEQLAVVHLAIDGDSAVTTVGDVVERFDLANDRWFHDEINAWIPLQKCVAWAEQSKAKSIQNVGNASDESRAFIEWSLNPQFAITANERMLTFQSDQVTYEIAVRPRGSDSASFYRYARLNSYKKAMTETKLPPFAELIVLDELERRGLMSESMTVTMPGLPDSPSFKMTIATKSNAAAPLR